MVTRRALPAMVVYAGFRMLNKFRLSTSTIRASSPKFRAASEAIRATSSLHCSYVASKLSEATIEDVAVSVEQQLLSNGGSSPSSRDYLKFVCTESNRALKAINAYNSEAELAGNDVATIAFELGGMLSMALLSLRQVSQSYGLSPSEIYEGAVEKIRGRTPYMPEWGDGSRAETCAEAEEYWQVRKKEQKAKLASEMQQSEQKVGATERDEREKLVFTVERLVATCPWTATMGPNVLLLFMKEEIEEALAEIDAISKVDDATEIGDGAQLRQALASELGDVMFVCFMVIYTAARDYKFEPSQVYISALTTVTPSVELRLLCNDFTYLLILVTSMSPPEYGTYVDELSKQMRAIAELKGTKIKFKPSSYIMSEGSTGLHTKNVPARNARGPESPSACT
eukprot:5053546-Pyramimonas_sp.AAC.1